MNLVRHLRHWAMSPLPVKLTLADQVLKQAEGAIEKAEEKTSAEFRLIVERSLPSSYLREDQPSAARAADLFGLYRVWDTEENNGVLIYLNLTDRAIEIELDRGAARVISESQLQEIINAMSQAFAAGDFAQGLQTAIATLADRLSSAFPNRPVHDPLPNQPIIL